MNYRMIRYIMGWLLLFEAAFFTVPAATALAYRERELWSFLGVMALCAAAGALLTLRKPSDTALYAREGFVIVSSGWILISLFGALPFLTTGAIPSFIDALFETVSGFTTTGASVLSDVESLPRSILMWRSFTHWIGGMGVLVFIMAFVPLSGGQDMQIMKAESTGPSVSKLVPRVRTTAGILYGVYLTLTLLMIALLLLGGLTPFQALTTAFGAAGTGGFSAYNDSLTSFSPYIQNVTTVFMLLFSVNFSCYFLLLTGRFRRAFSGEARRFFLVVAAVTAVVALNVRGCFASWADAVRSAAFTVASVISTTGFSVADFDAWPELSRALLVLIMFVGACAGSTGGGLKISRLTILLRDAANRLGDLIRPRRVKTLIVDGRPVEREVVDAAHLYLASFLVLFLASVLLVSLDGYDAVTNFTAVAATINNIGPGLGKVGPTGNYGFLSVLSKSVLIFDMLAGRLELFPMLVLFLPGTWRR